MKHHSFFRLLHLFLIPILLLCYYAIFFAMEIEAGKGGEGKGKGNGKGKGQDDFHEAETSSYDIGPVKRGWHRKKFQPGELDVLKANCQGKCKGQSAKAKAKRDTIRRHMKQTMSEYGRTDKDIDRQLDKIHDAKKALYAEQGLSDIEPHDNGLFGGDMILSEKQADLIIRRAQGDWYQNETSFSDGPTEPLNITDAPATTTSTPTYQKSGSSPEEAKDRWPSYYKGKGKGNSRRPKRASGMSLDTYGGDKWPSTTVNFYINPQTFTKNQADQIRAAVKLIESRTCLKFVETRATPRIDFFPADSDTDPGTCGWAFMGYQGKYNPVHINFNSDTCSSTIQGVIAHETSHCLGVSHEHQRYDRDRYVTIDWKNVDPQSLDVYSKDDPYDVNPYCVKYDLLSNMHYDAYIGGIDTNKPTAIPKSYPDYYIPRMGNTNKPSDNDILLLNKLYCTPDSCKDVIPYCGYACSDCTKYQRACPKSCGQCTINI